MSSATVKSSKSILAVDESSMRTNKVDQTSSFLLSMIILIGIGVLMLGVLFIMRSMSTYTKPFVVKPESIEGRGPQRRRL